MNIIDEIRQDVAGAALLVDWLGQGGHPVPLAVANRRAQACLAGDHGKPCSENVEPRWWERWKSRIAEAIRAELDLKAKLNLHVAGEESLFMCRACGCCLPLAVLVPIERLAGHTTELQLARMPDFCWKKQEVLRHLAKPRL